MLPILLIYTNRFDTIKWGMVGSVNWNEINHKTGT